MAAFRPPAGGFWTNWLSPQLPSLAGAWNCNVPLTPDVVDAVNTAAKKQGLSAPAWIGMTIDNALQQQSAERPQYCRTKNFVSAPGDAVR
jgi:hypothetical protein